VQVYILRRGSENNEGENPSTAKTSDAIVARLIAPLTRGGAFDNNVALANVADRLADSFWLLSSF
jgi:hypothetical protein